jgi:hypothetical protein
MDTPLTDIVMRLRQVQLARHAFELCGEALDEIERLRLENWQLRAALGYEVPADIPEGNFQCGLCEARRRASFEDTTGEKWRKP